MADDEWLIEADYAPIPKFVLKRKPAPPPLPSFTCVLCQNEIERDPRRPELEEPPVCFRCSIRARTRTKLPNVGVEKWSYFMKAHAIQCAIEEEIKRAKHHI